jgi:hypothetical protein
LKKFLFIFVLLVPHFSTAFASKADPLEPKNVQKKIKSLRNEITAMRQSIEDLEKEQRSLAVEVSGYEKKFQERFSKVLIPLLSWPSLPPAIQRASWIEESHLRSVLLKARERLVHEPLRLIADRELMLSRVKENKELLTEALKHLEEKEVMLNLQLEELQFLKKKMSRAKKG